MLVSSNLKAQISFEPNEKVQPKMQANSKEIEINFLSSYYEQDGNNGAVTGGIGTEKLTDISTIFTINVPLDSVNSINLFSGVDYYTSASTDNIDTYQSSASSKDVRSYAVLGYNKKNLKKAEIYGIKAGFSVEYDYTSVSGGLSYTKEWNNGNTSLNLVGQAFFDTWQLIFPYELRGNVSLSNEKRQSYNGQVNFAQVVNKRLQVGVSFDVIKMQGLLSTPFHRVYFEDKNTADIERLPNNRLKIPLGFRLNYFMLDNLVFRTYYRYYWDDFGINAHTFEIETPVKISSSFTVGPFYRYHTQTGSTHFAPYKTHLADQLFYTSDYDLSSFNSHKFGASFKYSPTFGILRSKKINVINRSFIFKQLETRIGLFNRSTNLNAFFISLNASISIK